MKDKRAANVQTATPGRLMDVEKRQFGITQSGARYDKERLVGCMTDDFRERMIAFLPRLSRFAHSLTGNVDLRDELVQETCVRALAHSDQWQRGTRLDSWMFKIAQNLWFDRLRADKYRGEVVDIDAQDGLIGADGRSVAEGRLALAEVTRGLAQLPPEHRVLIALVCVDGLTYKEAAAILDLPVGTVMSRLARARLALHDAINRLPVRNATTSLEARRGRNFK
jgi:RNA polymerase sigma-70 factor, ECF subfamily